MSQDIELTQALIEASLSFVQNMATTNLGLKALASPTHTSDMGGERTLVATAVNHHPLLPRRCRRGLPGGPCDPLRG
jgi:hypothetical protein